MYSKTCFAAACLKTPITGTEPMFGRPRGGHSAHLTTRPTFGRSERPWTGHVGPPFPEMDICPTYERVMCQDGRGRRYR
jgi:hypothetical protein